MTSVQGIRHPSSSWNAATQEADYLIYSIFTEVVLSTLGNVACLSGPVIYVRFDSLLRVWDKYIKACESRHSTLDKHWLHTFGEDRHLTQYVGAEFGLGATAVHTSVVSETEPAPSFKSLLVQRRRWFLGATSAEAAYLCKGTFWASTPLLSAWRLCKPAIVTDIQMVAVIADLIALGQEGSQCLITTVAFFFLADIVILAAFRVVRPRVGFGTCLLGRVMVPFVRHFSMLWALFNVRDREW